MEVYYGSKHITVKSTADRSVLFNGTIRNLNFSFEFSPDNLKENNKVRCGVPAFTEHKYYPYKILDTASEMCKDRYDGVYEEKTMDITPEEGISQHTYSIEKANGEPLFTARLLRSKPNDWFETLSGGRRRKPPYELLHTEKTQGIGYAENIYLDPVKQLIAAGIKNDTGMCLTCGEREWRYSLEEYIETGDIYYPDGRRVTVKNANDRRGGIFRPGCIVRDYAETAGGRKYWYAAEYSETGSDNQAEATIIFESDYADNALLRFEGSFIRQSVKRSEKIPGKLRGYIAYYRIQGSVTTIGRDGGEISEDIDLYGDADVIEEMAVSPNKRESINIINESDSYSVNQSINAPTKAIGLGDLIGLDKVKQTFEEFRKFGEYKRVLTGAVGKRNNGGDKLLDMFRRETHADTACVKNPDEISLHMVFLGSPGTGKTTVAERIAAMLKEYGLVVSNPIPIVCVKSDLVGQHIGETEAITRKKIDDAMGGILFIDEAYTLYESDNDRDFGKIALNEIMYAMETHRDRLVVILAGYTDEMLRMIREANTGLSSRLNWIFHFDDFTAEELWEILQGKVDKNSYRFDSETAGDIKSKAVGYFAELQKELDGVRVDGRQRHYFGNGRGVRSFFHYMQIGLAVRLSNNENAGDLLTFTLEEVDFAYNKIMSSSGKLKEEKKGMIGFSQ